MRFAILLLTALTFAPFGASPAWGADPDEEDLLGDDDDKPKKPSPAPSPGPAPKAEPLDDDSDAAKEGGSKAEDEDNLLGDEDPTGPAKASDNAEIYRAAEKRITPLGLEEQIEAWESYLAKYPDSSFKNKIEKNVEEMTNALYEQRVEREKEPVDANKAQLHFSQGVQLENMNPRKRIMVAFEYGIPDWLNFVGDFEWAFFRDFSVHGGLRRRYTGLSIETGVRWSPIKSARTHTILTLIGDLHFNAAPAFFGFRPQVAIGKRFFKKLDVQAQVGIDLELRKFFGFRLIGGANVTYLATDRVGIFAETSYNMKNLSWAGGPFRFNLVTFGMKFLLGGKKQGFDRMEANLGASAPYSSNYWMHHTGALTGQFVYALE
jgi:hypothetical protein